MANLDPWEVTPVAATSGPRDPWEQPPAAQAPAKPSSGALDVISAAGGPLSPVGIVTGGPLVNLVRGADNASRALFGKRLLPQDWQDYISGLQRQALQGATLNFGDEALAGVGSVMPGEKRGYGELLDEERRAGKQFSADNPFASGAAEVSGALTGAAAVPLGPMGRTAIGAGKVGMPVLERTGRFAGRILERALKGGALGAGFGYGSGFGKGEGGIEQRNEAALDAARTGAMFGAGANVAIPAVAHGVGWGIDRAKGLTDRLVGPQTKAAQTAAAGQIVEETGKKTAKDLLADLASGEAAAPKTPVPIPSANLMENPSLQGATRTALRTDQELANAARQGREAGVATALDDIRVEGAPGLVRSTLEDQASAARLGLDAAEAERAAATLAAQDAARAGRQQASDVARNITDDARAAAAAQVSDVQGLTVERLAALEAGIDDHIARLEAQGLSKVDAAHTAAVEALVTSGAVPDKAQASLLARQAIEQQLAANKRVGKDLYKAVPDGTRLDVNPVYDALAMVHREAYDTGRTGQIPERVRSLEILDLFRNATPQRLQGMKSMLYEDAGKLARAGDNTSAKWARDVAKSIDDVLSEGAAVSGSGVNELRTAASWWRENVVPFRQGAIGDILKVGRDGLPVIDPSTALAKVIRPQRAGGKEAIEQFVQLAGSKENALAAAEQWAIADVAEFALGKNGRVDLAKLNRWMRDRADTLNAMPGLRERLGNVRALAERAEAQAVDVTRTVQTATDDAMAAIERAKEIARDMVEQARGQGAGAVQQAQEAGRSIVRQTEDMARQRIRAAKDSEAARVEAARRDVDAIEKSAAKHFLGVDPIVAARAVMGSRDPELAFRQVYRLVQQDPEARRGLRRAVFDVVEQELGSFATVETAFRKGTRELFGRNQGLMEAAFGKEGANQAAEILRALELAKSHMNVPGNVGSATAANTVQDALMGAIADRTLHRLGSKTTFLPLLGPIMERLNDNARQAVMQMVREALFDPEKMRALLQTRITEQSAPAFARRLNEWTADVSRRATPATVQERANGGRIGMMAGGDPMTSIDRFGALLRGLRAADTAPTVNPHGPAPSLVPDNPYPIYYRPGQYGGPSGANGSPGGVAASSPIGGVGGGVLGAPGNLYDPMGGSVASPSGDPTGAGSVGPTGEGLSVDANAQSNTSNTNQNNPTSAAAAGIGRAVVGLLAPNPISIAMAIMSMAGRNIASPMAQQVTKDATSGTSGVGNTSGVTANNANQGVDNPSEAPSTGTPGVATGVGTSPDVSPSAESDAGPGAGGPGDAGSAAGASGDADASLKRGGYVGVARRVAKQRRQKRASGRR